MQKQIVPILIILAVLASCKTNPAPNRGPVSELGMVVSARPEASSIGAQIMEKGGNAIDAMVGVHFALAVTYPIAGNIGGGGFMVYREPKGNCLSLDFRETAPAAAEKDMYLREDSTVIEGASTRGHLAAGVPGSVEGMWEAHRRFGSLPWSALVQPAVDLASKGFRVTAKQAEALNKYQKDFSELNTNLYLQKDSAWAEGDILVQADLATTLEMIRDKGRDGFYDGPVAQKIVAASKAGDGIISLDDLATYEARWRGITVAQVDSYTVLSMPPPSSGGIALTQLLEMTESFPLSNWGHNTSRTVHAMVEAERRAYADRATHLGDPDFYPVPQSELVNPEYLKSRMADFNPKKATDSDQVGAGVFEESPQTTHYSIVDRLGNAISVTTTINAAYGAKVFVDGAGFLLNNEMDDFSAKPGVPNLYGLIGAEANEIQPRKRMLSSMTPTIVEKNGKLFMIVGTPGGSTIITSVFQTVLNVTEHGMTMKEAVAAPRFHHQWKPDSIRVEEGALADSTIKVLEQMGHTLYNKGSIGRVDAILVLPDGSFEGGADPRGDDAAVGVYQNEAVSEN